MLHVKRDYLVAGVVAGAMGSGNGAQSKDAFARSPRISPRLNRQPFQVRRVILDGLVLVAVGKHPPLVEIPHCQVEVARRAREGLLPSTGLLLAVEIRQSDDGLPRMRRVEHAAECRPLIPEGVVALEMQGVGDLGDDSVRTLQRGWLCRGSIRQPVVSGCGRRPRARQEQQHRQRHSTRMAAHGG